MYLEDLVQPLVREQLSIAPQLIAPKTCTELMTRFLCVLMAILWNTLTAHIQLSHCAAY